ncbi:hypothetical protein F2P56_030424, partial [Juglans regia]
MKTLSWNCRGLGNAWTVQDLCMIVEEKRPSVVFVMETKLQVSRLEGIRRRLRMEGCFGVDLHGRGDGLALFWKEEGMVDILNFSQRHISVWICDNQGRHQWLFTGFYGHPEASKRQEAWNVLKSIKPDGNKGWCVMGDFNEILTNDEKEGGRPRGEILMKNFRNALEEGGLSDLGWKGDKFTWSNRHGDESFTKERLDRVVANKKWIEAQKEVSAENLVARSSDHRPVLLSFSQFNKSFYWSHRVFKYEAWWASETDCKKVVKEGWLHPSRGRGPAE